ncbi:MAG: hypothetical protein ABIF18_02410 [archaeon]
MKNIYKIDLVVIVGSLTVLMFLIGYVNPLVVAPLDEYETSERDVLFVIDKADVLLIDDNPDFTTPDEYKVEDGLKINLEPGKYYWKVVGVLGSEIRTLTINSVVSLELRNVDGGYGVVNSGSVRLNVDVYNGTKLVDKVKLGVGDFSDAEGTEYIGGMDDE